MGKEGPPSGRGGRRTATGDKEGTLFSPLQVAMIM